MAVMEDGTQIAIHSKTAVMGSHLSFVGSWNGDNRSASLNSEDVAIVFDDELAKEMEACSSRTRPQAVSPW